MSTPRTSALTSPATTLASSMKMASLALLLVAGAGCDDQSAGPGAGAVDAVHRAEAPTGAMASGEAARRPLTVSDLPQELAQGADPVLLRLEPTRGGCMLSFARRGGEESIYGGAELCPGGAADAAGMIGARVRLDVGKGQWALCQDGTACADRPEIDVALGVQAI